MIVTPRKAKIYADHNFPSFPADWNISKHFTWNEVFINEKSAFGVPDIHIFENALKASIQFEKVRDLLNKPMVIHCWYRSYLHNQELKKQGLNPAMHSSHLYGMAIDYHVDGLAIDKIKSIIENNIPKNLQIRLEKNTTTWVHNDIGNPYSNDYDWRVFYA